MKRKLLFAAMLAFSAHAQADPKTSGDGACGARAVDNASFLTCDGDRAPEPLGLEISSRRAWQLKSDLGERVLLVDIHARSEIAFAGMPLAVDANVPYLEPRPGYLVQVKGGALEMDFDYRFLARMDALLAAANLHHGDPVVILCRDPDRSRLAAALLGEHGYEQVFVVSDGEEGWKSAAGAAR